MGQIDTVELLRLGSEMKTNCFGGYMTRIAE